MSKMSKIIDDMLKINMKLGDNYFYIHDGEDWEVYYTEKVTDYKHPIISSKTNTEESLRKFVKEHRTYPLARTIYRNIIILMIINLILVFVNNFTIKSRYVSGIITGANLMAIFIELMMQHIENKNYKIRKKHFEESAKRIKKVKKKNEENSRNT